MIGPFPDSWPEGQMWADDRCEGCDRSVLDRFGRSVGQVCESCEADLQRALTASGGALEDAA